MTVPPAHDARTTTVKLGGLTFTGGSAIAVLVGLLLLIVGVIAYIRPSLSNWPVWVSLAMWIAFVLYWNSAAKGAAPAERSESLESRRLHVRLMNAAMLLLFVPIPGLGAWPFPISRVNIALGLAIQFASFMFAVSARRHLGRNWSGAITAAHNHQLIRTGPYRVVRHPIYTAMIGMFAGAAIVSSTWHALLGVAVISFAYARKIPLEEKNLSDIFGPAYDAYRRETRALIPWLL